MLRSAEFQSLEYTDILNIKDFLDHKANQYNVPDFIAFDPICIPHRFPHKQDREIMALFAATLAWGQRKTIINKCLDLALRMDNAPFDFVTGHCDHDLRALLGFKHRTFNDTDLLHFIEFFKMHYESSDSLETAFFPDHAADWDVEQMLNHFRTYFFSLPYAPDRTRKHVTAPSQKSTCKRLNMFLRWMVRDDDHGVDFGIWKRIPQSKLMCPLDLHVDRVARKLQLIERKQTDWRTVLELTAKLREFDPVDPAKYDFALFGLGIEEKF